MRMTPAKNIRHRLPNVGFASFGISVEICLGCHNDAIYAKAALHRLFIDECLLYCVRLLDRAQSFERGDLCTSCTRDWRHTGPHGLSFHDHRATAALT